MEAGREGSLEVVELFRKSSMGSHRGVGLLWETSMGLTASRGLRLLVING